MIHRNSSLIKIGFSNPTYLVSANYIRISKKDFQKGMIGYFATVIELVDMKIASFVDVVQWRKQKNESEFTRSNGN